MSSSVVQRAEAAQRAADGRRGRYEAGEFDSLLGREFRAAVRRGDPRAIALEYEFWRAVLAADRGCARE